MAKDYQWPSINPGEFRHLLTFLQQSIVADMSGGGVVYAATNPPQTAFGSIKPVRGSDKVTGGQDVSQELVTITTWYQPWIATNGRWQGPSGNVYIIQAIENVNEMNTYLMMTCLGVGANT